MKYWGSVAVGPLARAKLVRGRVNAAGGSRSIDRSFDLDKLHVMGARTNLHHSLELAVSSSDYTTPHPSDAIDIELSSCPMFRLDLPC
jgi:hypothetical protein